MAKINLNPQLIVDWAKNLINRAPKKELEEIDSTLKKEKPIQHLSAYFQDTQKTFKEDVIPDHAAMPRKKITADLIKSPYPLTQTRLEVDEAKEVISHYTDEINSESLKKSTSKILDSTIETLSKKIDDELKKPDRDFVKLQEYVYKVVAAMMHRAKQTDQEFICESGIEIKVQAVKVQGTYNTWPALLITFVSSGISLAGGAAGVSPLAPNSWISPEKADVLARASQGIGTAGTGLSGVGSIFNSKGEGTRFVYQILLEEVKKKREDRESAKQQKSQTKNESLRTLNESSMELHRTKSGILSP